MLSFDVITNKVGVWTIFTSLTYAFLGFLFYFYFSRHGKETILNYLKAGVLGVLIFDFITGVLATPLMFEMTFEQAFIGQIPFTIMHLVTVSFYIAIITPLIDKYIVRNPKLNDTQIINYTKFLLHFKL
jgi:phage-related holin